MTEQKRYVVEFEGGWAGIEFRPIRLARVYDMTGTDREWPTKRQKATIQLSAGDDDEVHAAEQFALWLKNGAKSTAYLKENPVTDAQIPL